MLGGEGRREGLMVAGAQARISPDWADASNFAKAGVTESGTAHQCRNECVDRQAPHRDSKRTRAGSAERTRGVGAQLTSRAPPAERAKPRARCAWKFGRGGI